MPISSAFHISDEELDRFLREDVPFGDLTTALLDIGGRTGRMLFTTRRETVVCCTEEAARLLERVGCTVRLLEPSGALLSPGSALLEVTGPAASLHMGWKVAVNLVEAASGIATRTHVLVREARIVNPSVEIVATRKVFPGTKAVATKAVYAGGGLPHRLGLSESILVFPQHAIFLSGFSDLSGSSDLSDSVRELRSRAREKKVGVEVTGLDAALAAATAGAEIVQVDKLDPGRLAQLVTSVRAAAPAVVIAAAGGITAQNAKAFAATGVDLLVTSAMYWGAPADIGVSMEAVD